MPAVGEIGLHDATSVGPVLLLLQVVSTQLLPDVAGLAVHELRGVGPVITSAQDVDV